MLANLLLNAEGRWEYTLKASAPESSQSQSDGQSWLGAPDEPRQDGMLYVFKDEQEKSGAAMY